MTYYNRIKDTEVKLPDIQCGGIAGEFRLEAFRGVEFPRGSGIVYEQQGTRRLLQDWHGNLITDYGLNLYGSTTGYNHGNYVHVGTDNTPPQNSDVGLGAWIASKVYTSSVASAETSAPYHGNTVWRYRYTPGFGGGPVNINEVGVGRSSTNINLTSRALTVDGVGTPTTISVLADEYLDVYYRRRNYPAHIVEATGAPTDDSGTIDISGTSYGYTIRPAFVTVGGIIGSGSTFGWGTGHHVRFDAAQGFSVNNVTHAHAGVANCTLGAVTSGLSDYQGTGNTSDAGRSGSYVQDSFSQDLYYRWSSTKANEGAGIGGLVVKTTLGAYQIKFDTNLVKVDPETFTYYHNFSWARKTTWV